MHEPVAVTLSMVWLPTIVVLVVHACAVVVIVKELVVTVALFASVTLTVMALLEAGPDVVPLITPVPVLSPSPVGRVPLASANVLVPAPPDVASVNEYAVPLVAVSPAVGVVMERAVPAVTL